MKALIVIALAMFLIGCGKPPQAQSLGQFGPLVQKFVADAQAHGRSVDTSHLVINVGPLPETVSTTTVNGQTVTSELIEEGVCSLDQTGPTITVSTNAMSTFDDNALEELLYHELGHCLLYQAHRAAIDPDTSEAASIMNPYTIPGFWYSDNRANYLNELFGHTGEELLN